MVVVINGKSGDIRIRRIKPRGDLEVKSQEDSLEENAHSKSLQRKKEDRDPVTVGSHLNFSKGR